MRDSRNSNGFAKAQETAQPDAGSFPDGSGFTPGPWHVLDERDMTGEFWICVINPDGWEVSLAAVRNGSGEADDLGDEEANAHLIAAAPELLEALAAAMAFIDSNVADPDITEEMAHAWMRLQALKPRDVLAKASPLSARRDGRG